MRIAILIFVSFVLLGCGWSNFTQVMTLPIYIVTVSPMSPTGELVSDNRSHRLSTTIAIFNITADATEDVICPIGSKIYIGINAFVNDYVDDSDIFLHNKMTGLIVSKRASVVLVAGEENDVMIEFEFLDNFVVPAGGTNTLTVVMDTTQFEDSGDSITVYHKNVYANTLVKY